MTAEEHVDVIGKELHLGDPSDTWTSIARTLIIQHMIAYAEQEVLKATSGQLP